MSRTDEEDLNDPQGQMDTLSAGGLVVQQQASPRRSLKAGAPEAGASLGNKGTDKGRVTGWFECDVLNPSMVKDAQEKDPVLGRFLRMVRSK